VTVLCAGTNLEIVSSKAQDDIRGHNTLIVHPWGSQRGRGERLLTRQQDCVHAALRETVKRQKRGQIKVIISAIKMVLPTGARNNIGKENVCLVTRTAKILCWEEGCDEWWGGCWRGVCGGEGGGESRRSF
jgi:hypothetical protein